MKTKDAIQKCGGVRKLAKLLDISTAAVYAWGDSVPTLRAYQLQEKLTKPFRGPTITSKKVSE